MQLSIFSSAELPAKATASPDCERDWTIRVANSCLRGLPLLAAMLPAGWYGKTSPVSCRLTADGILEPCSGGLAELGYGFAYRILDAQYFGVAQRRRRVFVVGYLGDWRRAAAVLFERHSLLGHPAPSREQGKGIAPTLSARTRGGGRLGTDFECDGGLIPQVARALTANNQRLDAETETLLVAHAPRGEGFDASEDGTGRGTPIIPAYSIRTANTSSNGWGIQENVCHTLDTAQGVAIAFDCRASGRNEFGVGEIASTMRSMGHSGSHQNGGGHLAVAFQCHDGNVGEMGTLRKGNGNVTGGVPFMNVGMAVRRLTPRECERLQGFPDDYTLITTRSKPAADGPRYKALGNSMAAPVMRWIGERIEQVDNILEKRV